jgi:hypothetical protein
LMSSSSICMAPSIFSPAAGKLATKLCCMRTRMLRGMRTRMRTHMRTHA